MFEIQGAIRQCKLVVNIKKWVDSNEYKYVCIKLVHACWENWQCSSPSGTLHCSNIAARLDWIKWCKNHSSISLLVSDFQRSVWECSVYICSCRWLSAVCWMNEIIMTQHIFSVLWNWCGHYTDFRIEFTHLPNGVEGKNRDSFSFSP